MWWFYGMLLPEIPDLKIFIRARNAVWISRRQLTPKFGRISISENSSRFRTTFRGSNIWRIRNGDSSKFRGELPTAGLDVKKNNRDSLDLRPAVLNWFKKGLHILDTRCPFWFYRTVCLKWSFGVATVAPPSRSCACAYSRSTSINSRQSPSGWERTTYQYESTLVRLNLYSPNEDFGWPNERLGTHFRSTFQRGEY